MSLEALLMWQTYTNTSHSCAARGIKNSPAIFQNEVMTLASLNAEELVAKVSMEHGGFWDAIQLGNTARLCGSIRAVKLELSHCVRTRARWKVLWNSKKSVVWVNNQPLSVKLTGSTALSQRGPRNPTIYIRKYSELDRQAGRQACRHRQETPLFLKSLLDMSYPCHEFKAYFDATRPPLAGGGQQPGTSRNSITGLDPKG